MKLDLHTTAFVFPGQRSQAVGMGKDLAEQLKYGQAPAAQQTLEKLAQQLKKGRISQEQLDKIMKEKVFNIGYIPSPPGTIKDPRTGVRTPAWHWDVWGSRLELVDAGLSR